MQARDHQFRVGDKAVYPARGVAEVVSIEEKEIAGNRQKLYVLQLLDGAHKIMVPVNNAQNIGLRPPSTEKDIKTIYSILKSPDRETRKQAWNRRQRGFADKINTGSLFDIAEVMRDLYRLQTKKTLSYSERQMLERARMLIVKEIAVSRKKSEDKIRSEIDRILEN